MKILRAVIYSHHVRVAERWRVGRVFLAGDAAHAMPPWIGQGMSAGVRDAANLCWKLGAVLQGQAPDSLLESYQAERKPHVTEVTRRACLAGRIITERNRVIAATRNHVLRTLTRLRVLQTRLQRITWIPDARYDDGFFTTAGHRAVGWQIPQPWVTDASGTRVRLDDVLAGRWTVLHVGAATARRAQLDSIGRPTIRIDESTLADWLRRKKAAAVQVLRPDGFIYAAAKSGQTAATAAGRLPVFRRDQNRGHRMSTTTWLIDHTVTVAGKPIFVSETGTGPAVVMLHGGGPGASGVSNYSRNIGALATHFRLIVPDMPGYGRSTKGMVKMTNATPSATSPT